MAASCKRFAARADELCPVRPDQVLLRSHDASNLVLNIRGRWLTSADRFTDLKSPMASEPPLGLAIIGAGISRRGTEKSLSFER